MLLQEFFVLFFDGVKLRHTLFVSLEFVLQGDFELLVSLGKLLEALGLLVHKFLHLLDLRLAGDQVTELFVFFVGLDALKHGLREFGVHFLLQVVQNCLLNRDWLRCVSLADFFLLWLVAHHSWRDPLRVHCPTHSCLASTDLLWPGNRRNRIELLLDKSDHVDQVRALRIPLAHGRARV